MKRLIYKYIIKPILFRFDAEEVHNSFTKLGEFFGKSSLIKRFISLFLKYENGDLEQNLFGLKFNNPVGLAAGFDYNAKLTNVLDSVGFSFESVGTVTFSPYEGNMKPRLVRLPNSQSLLVNKGFKSHGIHRVLSEINMWDENNFNVGISIGATNSEKCSTDKLQIKDIIQSFEYLKNSSIIDKFAYLELNISCPNVLGSGSLADPINLRKVLNEIRKLKIEKPLFVKFQLEIDWELAKKLIKIMIEYNVDAIILSNLLKHRDTGLINEKDLDNIKELKGNFSGKPTFNLSNDLISKVYLEFGDKIKIIGLGGIFSAEDAYRKMELGASLVQLITGMIYEGPQLIGDINKGILSIMRSKGFRNISEVIGSAHTQR